MGILKTGKTHSYKDPDANGQYATVFTSRILLGFVGVCADLYYDQGGGLEVAQSARQQIYLGVRL